jgi:HK97 family phage portal protein
MSPRARRPQIIRSIAWKIASAFSAMATGQALPPWDDYWFQRPGFDSAAGMAVSPETAMRLSAVFSCVRVRSETLASLPLIIYRRTSNGGKERATDHPLYRVLHDSPNQWQTSLEFIEMMQGHLDLRGNAFARILPGPKGAIDQLIPLHPDLVQVFRLPNGRLKYQLRSRFSATIENYAQDEIFHLRGLSSDGLVGLSPVALQREMLGKGLAMQDYGARFFANGARPSGILQHPGKFKDDGAREKFRKSWQESQTGEHQHSTAVLEEAMTYTAIGVSNKDSQFLEATLASREEIAGMFRVPPHKIGIMTRSTNNNIEHQGIEFVTDCMRPVAIRWERRINNDLIDPVNDALGGEDYFAEFLVDGLLRGDLKSRYDAYAVGRTNGWLTPNDVCRFENLNPIPPEKGGDDYLRPVNMVPAQSPPPAVPVSPPPGPGEPAPADQPAPDAPDDPGANAAAGSRALESRVHDFALAAAGRVVRKEVTALRKALQRGKFDSEVENFYAEHAVFVAESMRIDPAVAGRYIERNRELLSATASSEERSSALDWIEDMAPDVLTSLAIGNKSFSHSEEIVQ